MAEANWSETKIARAISRQTLARKCVVLVDNCNWTGHECDVLAVTMDLRIIDVEVKISRSDLKADAHKDKWWIRLGWTSWLDGPPAPPRARDWPPKVWKHYYALPREIWDDALFDCLPSPKSGVLLLRERQGLDPEEICNLLDLSLSNVRVLLHRARLKVFATLEHFEETGQC